MSTSSYGIVGKPPRFINGQMKIVMRKDGIKRGGRIEYTKVSLDGTTTVTYSRNSGRPVSIVNECNEEDKIVHQTVSFENVQTQCECITIQTKMSDPENLSVYAAALATFIPSDLSNDNELRATEHSFFIELSQFYVGTSCVGYLLVKKVDLDTYQLYTTRGGRIRGTDIYLNSFDLQYHPVMYMSGVYYMDSSVAQI